MKFNIPNFQEHVILAPFTTMKVGGPARWFVTVATTKEFIHAVREALRNNVPYCVLGKGANVLISDKGFDGLMIRAKNSHYVFRDTHVTAEAGTDLTTLVMQSAQRGLAGLEFAAGIPSTLGGAVRGNACSRESEMKNVIETVDILNAKGEQKTLTVAQCEFSYRNSRMKQQKEIVLSAVLKLERGSKDTILEKVKENFSRKHKTQELKFPSSGCIFMNPAASAAGKLIENAGLKGMRIGGAKISEIHGNFVINENNATAEDIIMLISVIKQKIRTLYRIQLHEEIQYIGFD